MAETGVAVTGLVELEDILKTFPDKLHASILQGAVLAGAQVTAAEIAARAPRRTGELQASVTATRGKGNADEVEAGVAFTSPGRRYWHLAEFGTVKEAPRPFIRPGIQASSKQASAAVVEYIKKRVDRELRRLAKTKG
jgi:HK97 gp10 family phage protein